MPNLYGVANPVMLPVVAYLAGDVASTAGSDSALLTTAALIAPSSGFYYPLVWYSLAFACGATAPGANSFVSFHIGAGANVDTQALPDYTLVANTSNLANGYLIGSASEVPWRNPGSTITVTINSVAQPVTVRQRGSKVLVTLFRAPDQ